MAGFGKTHIGKVRKNNEDYYFVNGRDLYVLADGMGGHLAGDVASRNAVEYIKRNYNSAKCICENTQNYLAETVQGANRYIYDLAQTDAQCSNMGTTLIIAYLQNNILYFAHVGDSRLYLHHDGQLRKLTHDHSLVGEMLARGEITEEQALCHPQKNIITRALGVEPEVKVDTGSVVLTTEDVFLICSDGLSNMVRDEDISRLMSTESDLEKLADLLIEAANSSGGTDNITVVLGSI